MADLVRLVVSDLDKLKIDPGTVMRVRRARGLPIMRCRAYLENLEPLHRSRLLDAVSRQAGPGLHDPIEDDPALAEIFETVRRDAQILADRQMARQTGLCHLIWKIIRELLRERHGIEWFSPTQMNPGSCFD